MKRFFEFLKKLIWYKRSNEKWTDDIAYSFIEWKLFSGIQVSLTDYYMISIIIDNTELSIWETC